MKQCTAGSVPSATVTVLLLMLSAAATVSGVKEGEALAMGTFHLDDGDDDQDATSPAGDPDTVRQIARFIPSDDMDEDTMRVVQGFLAPTPRHVPAPDGVSPHGLLSKDKVQADDGEDDQDDDEGKADDATTVDPSVANSIKTSPVYSQPAEPPPVALPAATPLGQPPSQAAAALEKGAAEDAADDAKEKNPGPPTVEMANLVDGKAIDRDTADDTSNLDGALSLIRNVRARVVTVKRDNLRLRQALKKSLGWGSGLDSQLRKLKSSHQKTTKDLTQRLRVLSAEKAKEDVVLLTTQRQDTFEIKELQNATHTSAVRAKALRLASQRLTEAQRENKELRKMLEKAAANSLSLTEEITQANQSRQQAVSSWRASQAKLTKEATLLSAAKAHLHDREVAWKSEKSVLLNASVQQQTVTRYDIAALQANLTNSQKDLLDLQHNSDAKMKSERNANVILQKRQEAVEKRDGILQKELAILKNKLGMVQAHESKYSQSWGKERLALTRQLQTQRENSTRTMDELVRVSKETLDLHRKVLLLQDGARQSDAARRRAEEAAKRAKGALTASQVGLKQVLDYESGLKSQAAAKERQVTNAVSKEKLANEARDTVKAMLADAQQKVVNLGHQYSDSMQALARSQAQAHGTADIADVGADDDDGAAAAPEDHAAPLQETPELSTSQLQVMQDLQSAQPIEDSEVVHVEGVPDLTRDSSQLGGLLGF